MSAGRPAAVPAQRAGRALLPWLGALAGVVWCLLPFLAGRGLSGADLSLFDLPRLRLLGELLQAGRLPGWNPYQGGGCPLLADPGLAAVYPPQVALLLLVPPSWALQLLLAGHVALAYAGARRLALGRGLPPLAATLVALAWALSGLMTSLLMLPALLMGAAWLVWGVALAGEALRAPALEPARLGLASAALALAFLGSSPEMALSAGLLSALLGLVDGVPLPRLAGRLALVGVFALALSAAVLAPFLAFLPHTDRGGGWSPEIAGRWSLPPAELLGLLLPRLGGELPIDPLDQAPLFPTLYLGGVPLAALAVGSRAAARRRGGRVLLLGAGLLLVYALGRHVPLHGALLELVPPLRSLRYPAKYFIPLALLLALLAGEGWGRRRELGRALLGVALLALVGSGVAAVLGRYQLALRALQPAAAGLCGSWLAARASGPGPLLGLALADLLLAGGLFLPLAPRGWLEGDPALLGPVRAAEAAAGQPLRVAATLGAWEEIERLGPAPGSEGVPRGALIGLARRDALFPNAGAPHGVRSVKGFGVMATGRFSGLERALERAPEPRPPLARRLALLGAQLVVTTEGEQRERLAGAAAPFAVVGPWRLLRLHAAPAWAAVTGAEPVADPRQAQAALLAGGSDPRRVALVEGLEAARPAPSTGEVQVLELGFDRLAFRVRASAPAVLVVREAWAPGWSARVGVAPAPVLPADLVFRAVPVPAGEHEVSLEYRAPLGREGLLVSLLAWTGLGWLLLRERRRRLRGS